jgi:hypothetical protein
VSIGSAAELDIYLRYRSRPSALHLAEMESPDSEAARKVPPCPVCGAALERVYSRFGDTVYVCIECHTGITVPRRAWDIADVKTAQRQDHPDKKVS